MKQALRMLILLAIGVGWYAIVPSRARVLPTAGGIAVPIRGAIHVHTQRSDGTGTVDEVADAAARAGLAFVIFTDHGDGTRKPVPPTSLHGVLCIDAVEISTEGGHVVALGLGQAPYPLGGKPRDVLEDIARLGGFAIAAHPASPKPELRWTEWSAPLGGLEWMNGDSEWRDEERLTLARMMFTYPLRRPESLALLLDRPDAVLAQWDALTMKRRVVAVAGADAHARIGLRTFGEPYDNGVSMHLPSYEQVFRTFSIALPAVRLIGEPVGDASSVINAIRQGHVYSSIDALAAPALVSFTAESGNARAAAGDTLALDGPVTLRVETGGPPDAVIAIYKNGTAFRIGDGSPIEEKMPGEAAVYRVEVRLPGAPGRPPVPWMLSNPIYVGRQQAEVPSIDPHAKARAFASLYENGALPGASLENSALSAGRLNVVPVAGGGTQLAYRYAVGGRASESPYAALVMPAGKAIQAYDRLMFTARADRPMRLSVQLRAPGGQGRRWQRSVFIDQMPRTVTVYFDEMAPRGQTTEGRPELTDVDSLLFVVDGVNTRIGSSGQVWIDSIKYAR